ncbi:hypothetical protein [Streptomyces sp. NPDC047042]|uniref:hypothetical protein n=1 Tax=Streptomyces sp. NPDC047042 TaxID=3154807 RepID=UPI0034067E9B
MRRTTHVIDVLYALLALGLLRCALATYQAGAWGYSLFYGAAAMGAALAIVHTSWLLDEYRNVLARLDQPATPTRITTRQDATVAQALAAACCEVWWSTAGTQHDPQHCTRKDQTT